MTLKMIISLRWMSACVFVSSALSCIRTNQDQIITHCRRTRICVHAAAAISNSIDRIVPKNQSMEIKVKMHSANRPTSIIIELKMSCILRSRRSRMLRPMKSEFFGDEPSNNKIIAKNTSFNHEIIKLYTRRSGPMQRPSRTSQ